ncbi:MAG: hypothetical protein HYY13_10195 [Nitrospirae bacterium]|nr:hypothetical protein [Nitrospirota bacterium]
MPYEPEKDKAVRENVVEVEGTRLKIGVYSYNGGEKKIGIVRVVRKRDGTDSFAPLGRLRKAEALLVRENLGTLIELLD